ncbi:MAG: DUF4199 domain-containing protein [Prevotellaceae bacterium]|jgi:hypothetical protein|nr:DUF4199 domain-containing protein [Prevotellaceae bacterium]
MVKIAAGYGIIMGFVMIVAQIISSVTGLSMLLILSYIGGIFFSTIAYREKYLNGTISYGKSLLFGILISGFTFIIIGVYLYIWISFNPVEFSKAFNTIMEGMKTNGYAVSDISEKMIFNPVFLLMSYLFTGLLAGLSVSAITSLFTRKK